MSEMTTGLWLSQNPSSLRWKAKGKRQIFITERSRGITSWIRFGEEEMKNLLVGVEECCKDFAPARRSFVWRENGRIFRLECRENNARRFLLCSAIDAEGEKHMLFFSEGRGFLNGWALLAEKIRGLGLKPSRRKNP